MSKKTKIHFELNEDPNKNKMNLNKENQKAWEERKRREAEEGLNRNRVGPTRLTRIRRAANKHKGGDKYED